MTQPIEKQVEDLNANIKRIGDEIKPLAEQAIKEAKNAGEVNAETRAKVDELLMKHGEAQARLTAIEQEMKAGQNRDEPEAPRSAGRMVVHPAHLRREAAACRPTHWHRQCNPWRFRSSRLSCRSRPAGTSGRGVALQDSPEPPPDAAFNAAARPRPPCSTT